MPPRGYLERLREICSTHDILLIFDEVITAFGSTETELERLFDAVATTLDRLE